MLRYLIIILDSSAPSFCHYPSSGEGGWMSVDILRQAVRFAQCNALMVNVLVGDRPIPDELLEELDKINHIFIGPASATEDRIWDMTVIEGIEALRHFESNEDKNVIFRCSRSELAEFCAEYAQQSGRFARLNVILSDLQKFDDADLALCRNADYFRTDGTDAVSRSCEAGVRHITVAPDGHFYICPAFFYDRIYPDCGALPGDPEIPDGELLNLEHAPLCRSCDARHCKRCVYLNLKTTREINTPSRRQCLSVRETDPFDTYEK
ncbi:MAG: hypothetical protein KBS58_07245 [Bacteroidales bacterium]|nr:hypothetical protein [Candidatus Cacconaster equi]